MERQELEARLRQAENQITRLTQNINEADRELQMLSYSISHDLNAPLRAIKGFSKALVEDYHEKLDDEARRYLDIIISSTNNVSRLMDGLLALSRLSRQEMNPGPVKMKAFVSEIAEELKSAENRKIEITIDELPDAVADPNLLRIVWTNLLTNAIKFTAPRETALIEISGKIEGNESVYSIRDNGVGFNMKYAEKLFGLFQRFHTEKEFPGTGTGLAIVQRLVRRHGGKIQADAKVDGGAVFTFSVPAGAEE